RRIVSSAVLLTLLFGVGVAFLLASLDNTVRSSRDVEEKLKRPLLGIEPLLGSEALRAASTLGKGEEPRETDPRFAEAMRTIRTQSQRDSSRLIRCTSCRRPAWPVRSRCWPTAFRASSSTARPYCR